VVAVALGALAPVDGCTVTCVLPLLDRRVAGAFVVGSSSLTRLVSSAPLR
jgi:hypothetical protein